MSAKLRIVGIMAMLGACSTAFAAAGTDPHERARNMIAPAFPAQNPTSPGVRGRLIEPSHDFGDPHIRAERLIRHNDWPPMAAQAGPAPTGVGYADPHHRAQSMILGGER